MEINYNIILLSGVIIITSSFNMQPLINFLYITIVGPLSVSTLIIIQPQLIKCFNQILPLIVFQSMIKFCQFYLPFNHEIILQYFAQGTHLHSVLYSVLVHTVGQVRQVQINITVRDNCVLIKVKQPWHGCILVTCRSLIWGEPELAHK